MSQRETHDVTKLQRRTALRTFKISGLKWRNDSTHNTKTHSFVRIPPKVNITAEFVLLFSVRNPAVLCWLGCLLAYFYRSDSAATVLNTAPASDILLLLKYTLKSLKCICWFGCERDRIGAVAAGRQTVRPPLSGLSDMVWFFVF